MSNTLMLSNYIFNTNVNAHAKIVYAALKRFSNKVGICFPSRNTLVEMCNISLSSVRKALKDLSEAKVLSKEHRYRINGSQTSNIYTLSPFLVSGEYYFPVRADIFGFNLSNKSIVVYMYLCSCADKNNSCFPSISKIAMACSISTGTVKNSLKELINSGLINKENQFRENGGKKNNMYQIVTGCNKIESKIIAEGITCSKEADECSVTGDESVEKTETENNDEMEVIKKENQFCENGSKKNNMYQIVTDCNKDNSKTSKVEEVTCIEEVVESYIIDNECIKKTEEENNKRIKEIIKLKSNIFSFKLQTNSIEVPLYQNINYSCKSKYIPFYDVITGVCKITYKEVEKAVTELRDKGILYLDKYTPLLNNSKSNIYNTIQSKIWRNIMSNNIILSNTIFTINISSHGKVVYAALKKFSNEDGVCFISRNILTETCNISLSSVQNALKELCEVKVLKKESRYHANGGQITNIYTLFPDQISREYHFCVRDDIFDLGLSDKSINTYMYLCSCVDADDLCVPSLRQVATSCNISTGTVIYSLKMLINSGLIIKENQFHENGGKCSNLYKIIKS